MKDKSKRMIVICLVIIFLTGIITHMSKSDNGSIVIKEVTISPYGADLSASMYIPEAALETDENGSFLNQYPAVIVNAGFTNSRSWLDNVSMELAKSGYVVVSFDMYGHGHSEYTINRGYSKVPSPFEDDTSLLGAVDMLNYVRSLGFVDQTRIGMCGHSLGGSATGRMAEKSAGFFTLQDQLLNLLHDTFGVAVTPEQVAEQNADAVAAASLSAEDLGAYHIMKEAIAAEYNTAVRNIAVFDSDVAGCTPKEVEVAGVPVWRDVQANIIWLGNISGGMAKGAQQPDFLLSKPDTLTFHSQSAPVERDIWYALNLSGTQERLDSTKLTGLYGDVLAPSVQESAHSNSLRLLTTPHGWHGYTYFSVQTAKDTVQFFSTVFSYYQGQTLTAQNVNLLSSNTGMRWVFKDVISAIAFFALIFMILPLTDLVMRLPFFASMQKPAPQPVESKRAPVFWVFMALMILIPVCTYSQGVGWGSKIAASPLSTVQLATQTAFWAIVITAILLALMVVKYFFYDKKKFQTSFWSLYGLDTGWKNILKSVALALIVFGMVSVLLTVYYNLFDAAHMKFTLGGAVMFAGLSKTQYYSWLLYVIYFLPFYLLNSMLVNSARLKDMNETLNTWLVAGINCVGMFILAFFQIILGLYRTSAAFFRVPPGSSATIYNLSFFFVMLFISAIYTRKLYEKTGSSVPGAMVNAMIFTIPAIQVFTYYSFL